MTHLEIIVCTFLGVLCYNIVFKAVIQTIVKTIMSDTKFGKEVSDNVRKSFKERLEEKQNENS